MSIHLAWSSGRWSPEEFHSRTTRHFRWWLKSATLENYRSHQMCVRFRFKNSCTVLCGLNQQRGKTSQLWQRHVLSSSPRKALSWKPCSGTGSLQSSQDPLTMSNHIESCWIVLNPLIDTYACRSKAWSFQSDSCLFWLLKRAVTGVFSYRAYRVRGYRAFLACSISEKLWQLWMAIRHVQCWYCQY